MSAPLKLSIGCSRAGSLNNPTPLREIEAVWRQAVAGGCTEFDTANIYAQGDSERALGRLLRACPEADLLVVTKAGFVHGRKAALVRLAKPVMRPLMALRAASQTATKVRSEMDRQDFTPAFLETCLRGSLRRLGVAAAPGFMLHDPSAEVLRRPETARFLLGLKPAGLARKVGVSLCDADADALQAALALGPIDLLQLPVTAYETAVRGTDLAREIQGRGIRLTVRQVLRRPEGPHLTPHQALAPLRDDPTVASILVGVSRSANLAALLREFGR